MTEQPNPYREGLPERPDRIASLHVDKRGFPVPAFVQWIDGEPDHRVIDRLYMPRAIKFNLCWTCGQPMGVFRTFVLGPMCCVNRVSAEPPSHFDCAQYSVKGCPFLSKPHMHRRDAGLPDSASVGEMNMRNPGVMCLWTTRTFKPVRMTASDGMPGLLFDVGEPTSMSWWREGREATRAEVMDGISSGLPILQDMAEKEGNRAVFKLGTATGELINLLDKHGPR